MGAYADLATIPALIEVIKNRRLSNYEVFHEVGEDAVASHKIALYKVSYPELTEANSINWALTRMGVEGVPVLIQYLDDKDEFLRQEIVRVLGEIGDALATSALLLTLDDIGSSNDVSNSEEIEMGESRRRCSVFGETCRSLGKIRDTSAIPALITKLCLTSDASPINYFYLGTLVKFIKDLPNNMAYVDLGEYIITRVHKSRLTIQYGESPHKTSTHPLLGNAYIAEALGAIGDVTAIPALIDILKDSLLSNRIASAKALGNIRSPIAIPALLEVSDDMNSEVHTEVLRALGKIGDLSSVPILINTLSQYLVSRDENEEVTLWHSKVAAIALSEIGSNAIPQLLDNIENSDWGVRAGIIYALELIGDLSVVPFISSRIQDKDERVCKQAISSLGHLGDVSAMPHLIRELNGKDPYKRSLVAESLENMSKIEPLLNKILASKSLSPQVKIDTLNKLKQVKYKDEYRKLEYDFPNIKQFCKLIEKDSSEDLQLGAEAVLDWLERNRFLLKPSQPDEAKDRSELLRTAVTPVDSEPETLLIPSDSSADNLKTFVKKPSLWKRIFGKR